LVKAFNYALDRLSRLDVPGLPEFQEERQIVFACATTVRVEPNPYLESPPNPDIVLVKWNTFKWVHGCGGAAYSESYESTMCCESGWYRPRLSWLDLLSTLEVKRGGPGDAGQSEKGRAKQKFVKPTYTGDFGKSGGDLGVTTPSKSAHAVLLNVAGGDNSTPTCTSAFPSPFLTFS
jgi:hypothetical protein